MDASQQTVVATAPIGKPVNGTGMNRRTLLKKYVLTAGLARATDALASSGSPVAQTRYGKIRGVETGGISIFKGIPYGGPTEGAGRFMPPRKPENWSGIRDASRTGPRCIQAPGNLFDTAIGDYFCGGRKEQLGLSQQTDSENCLVLNVLTPGLKGKRPTMVYIHGGGFTSGSGIIALAADAFPREEDVVLVSVNHRLNIFGYTYLGGISEKFADSGNAGMLDLVAALEWVRDNISNFGGDPANVTIFGESGGGGKVSALMAMPSARGLFSKAIIESGSSLRAGEKEQATARARALLGKIGIPENRAEDLQTIPASALFAAGMGGGPIVDGRSIPDQTWDPNAPGVSASVPMIVGTCKDETAWLIGDRDPSTFTLDEQGMRSRLMTTLRVPAPDVEELITIYRKARPHATASDIFFEISSDRSTRMNAITQVERRRQRRARRPPGCIILRTTPRWMAVSTGRSTRRNCPSFFALCAIPIPISCRNNWPEPGPLSPAMASPTTAGSPHGQPTRRIKGQPWSSPPKTVTRRTIPCARPGSSI